MNEYKEIIGDVRHEHVGITYYIIIYTYNMKFGRSYIIDVTWTFCSPKPYLLLHSLYFAKVPIAH